MNKEVFDKIESEKIIVIVRGVDSEKLIPVVEAMYKGGIRLLEITFSADKRCSDEDTAKNIKMLVERFRGKMLIGAGTVLTKEQVDLVYEAGGRFIISPDTNEEVILRTKELNLISIPGALTPSEITKAVGLGADFVKLFPISNLGLSYFKAIKAPLSHVKFLAVGGINEKNIPEYLKAGIFGFGIGSNIVDLNLVQNNDFYSITQMAKNYSGLVKNCNK